MTLDEQLRKQRRKVDADTFDVILQQLFTMLEEDQIDIAPAYQRRFRWEPPRCSKLVESLFIGIPIPSLFVATNRDASWELVDGVQRISALVKFAGSDELRAKMGVGDALRLIDLEKLTEYNKKTFAELPEAIRLQFTLRPIRIITLSDKSDRKVRFDLFHRINSGGIALTDQEIRDCVYRGRFSQYLEERAKNRDFHTVVRLTKRQNEDGTREECVLRFFAFLNRYESFVHSVIDFLNDYSADSQKEFDYREGTKLFKKTFKSLAAVFPDGLIRPSEQKQVGTTSLVLYEAVSVGAALALKQRGNLDVSGVESWLKSPILKRHTTGATNDLAAVKGRVEFCRDRFLGIQENAS